jgi:hypothetical protein
MKKLTYKLSDHYLVTSLQNRRGIAVSHEDLEDTLENYFGDHKLVGVTDISEETYMNIVYGMRGLS